jgi:Fe-S cluster biogenesis protein NfuA
VPKTKVKIMHQVFIENNSVDGLCELPISLQLLYRDRLKLIIGMTISKKKIEHVVTKRIVPLLELDRGSLEIIRFDDSHGNLQIRFGGSYRGSPCRETICRYVVEPVLKEEFSEIKNVEWID